VLITVANQAPISRSERSAAAAAEVSSLAPSRGIDARSLAASVPRTFQIRRVDESSGRGNFSSPRGGPRGGFTRGAGGARGGLRGRGARGRGGRGGARGRGKRRRGPNNESAEREEVELYGAPLSKAEKQWLDGFEQGVLTTYQPGQTEIGDLLNKVPASLASPVGMKNTILGHMRALAGQYGPDQEISKDKHEKDYNEIGATLYEDREIASFENLPKMDRLSAKERQAVLGQLVGGVGAPVRMPDMTDAIGVVDGYATKNETYLPPDIAAVKEKVNALLAQSKPRAGGQQVATK
jgi:hypothetical protein